MSAKERAHPNCSVLGLGLIAALAVACGPLGDATAGLSSQGTHGSVGVGAGAGSSADAGSLTRLIPSAFDSSAPVRTWRRSHLGVYRPSTSVFYLKGARPGWADPTPDNAMVYGQANWVPLMGDWDGNGTQTLGVWSNSVFYLRNSDTLGYADLTFTYGNPTDIPVVGDWDGNGTTTVGVFRDGTWYLRNTNTPGVADITFSFGQAGDIPVVGDWDGDGVDTIGVVRNGTWYLRNSNSAGPADITIVYGNPSGDIPVVGDWDGDGVDTVGVYRTTDNTFYLSNHNVTGVGEIVIPYGNPGDVPIVGNWGSAEAERSMAPAELAGFFPIAVDFQSSANFARWQSRGVNTVIRVPDTSVPWTEDLDAWTQAANDAGLKMIRRPRTNPADDNGEANLLAWERYDEPEGAGISAANLQSDESTLAQVNPRPYFANFAGPTVMDLGNCNGPGDGTNESCYPGYLAGEDWVSNDIYPVESFGGDLSLIGATMDKLTRWSGGKPQFQYIETASWNGSGVAPTPDQFRGEIWSAIIHGARGLFYFPMGNCTPGCSVEDATPADVAAEMTRQDALIAQLAPLLQAQINPPSAALRAPPPFEVTWRRDATGNTYFVVLNQSAQSLPGSFQLMGVLPQGAAIQVFGEPRTVGNRCAPDFSDTFGPYGVHVYVVPAGTGC